MKNDISFSSILCDKVICASTKDMKDFYDRPHLVVSLSRRIYLMYVSLYAVCVAEAVSGDKI